MKSSKEWAVIIIAYMQKNPVKTLEEATAQIVAIIEMIQEDCGALPPPAANDDEPDSVA